MTPNKLIECMLIHKYVRAYAWAGASSSIGTVFITSFFNEYNLIHVLSLIVLQPLLTGVIMSLVVIITDSLVTHDEPYPGVVFSDNSTIRELIRLTLCAWWFPITFYVRYRWG